MPTSNIEASDALLKVTVQNIGGIDQTSVELSPGVNVLTGRNATNRTSFLQALIAATGSKKASLKGDAEEGSVKLTTDRDQYTRFLSRKNHTVQFSGDPVLDDSCLADLFAFLLENNDARRAVTQADDLRQIIMRPVDTKRMNAEIERLESAKRHLDQEIDDIERRSDELPPLEQRRTELQTRIEDITEELEEKRAEIDDADIAVGKSQNQESKFDAVVTELQTARSELNDIEFQLETERASLEELTSERIDVERELAEYPDVESGALGELEAKLDTLRDHKQSLDSTVSNLQRIIQFNEGMLGGQDTDLHRVLTSESETRSVSDQLLTDTTVCWTCGSEVETDAIEDTIAQLRTLRQEKASERSDVSAEIDDIRSEKQEIESVRQERTNAEQRLQHLDSEIDTRKSTIESLETQREEQVHVISDLDSRVEDLQGQEQSEVLSLHKAINELEFERERFSDELASIESDIDEIKTEVAQKEELETEIEEVSQQLTELRTRIETLEQESVKQFNDHMDALLNVLQYRNLARIWIERTEKTVREGRKKVQRGSFDLHVVRTAEDGATYEDTIDHLSESEREVTGLVFALAGYLVHDVHEVVPFMLLDSLEAIDSERIARLVSYFDGHASYLVVALLNEDAQALSDEYRRISEI